tara:strand:+ start:30 stop:488 length:459 start_codon:yes stop_codon:yes gene_type:complete
MTELKDQTILNIFGEEEFRTIHRSGKMVENYFVSKSGDVYSGKTKKLRKQSKRGNPNNYGNVYNNVPIRDFDGTILNCSIHRAVMETWKPIDEYPPDQLKDDWDKAPESFKQWVRDSAFVDHIDGDKENNHVNNLRWVTPRQNNFYVKSNGT